MSNVICSTFFVPNVVHVKPVGLQNAETESGTHDMRAHLRAATLAEAFIELGSFRGPDGANAYGADSLALKSPVAAQVTHLHGTAPRTGEGQ